MDFSGGDAANLCGVAVFAGAVLKQLWKQGDEARADRKEQGDRAVEAIDKVNATLSLMTERLARIDDRTYRAEAVPVPMGESKTSRSKTQTPFTSRRVRDDEKDR